MVRATRLVPSTRLSSSSRLILAVQRRCSPMFVAARCTTASALARASGSSSPDAGSQWTWSGAAGRERVRRRTWWPSACSRPTRAVPISPDAPVTATSIVVLPRRPTATVLPSQAAVPRVARLGLPALGCGVGRLEGAPVAGLGAGAVAAAGQQVAGQLEAGPPLAGGRGTPPGEPRGAVEDDHLVARRERLGRGLHDRRPLLGQLLADHGVLVLGQGVGPGLDCLCLSPAPCLARA